MIHIVLHSSESNSTCNTCSRRDRETREAAKGRPLKLYDLRTGSDGWMINVTVFCEDCLRNLGNLINLLEDLNV